ncbi:ferritin-like domain-containing protein [Sorangium sp. So ce367]|uniref:ferritin-like domain-containing protein n=1 Tax=Sorangium sp. So ce367 TaxID=3133305 RepID=UPI003F63C955
MTTTSFSSAQFQIALAQRLTRAILTSATLGMVAGGAACSGDVVRDRTSGEGGGGLTAGGGGRTSGDASSGSRGEDDESSGSHGEMAGQGGGIDGGPVSASSGGVYYDTVEGTHCIPREEVSGQGGAGGAGGVGGQGGAPASPCPPVNPYDSKHRFPGSGCGVYEIGEGVLRDGQCCYDYTAECASVGRPFVVGERARTARAARREAGAWGAAARPDVAQLTPADRAALADAWLRDALLEHASVASFSRFALEMMAVGAPAAMLAAAHEAAGDEVRHAALCFGLASAYAGAALEPAPFEFGGLVEVSSDLPEMAARAVREGCVGETLAAVLASEQLAHASDAAVRGVLATIAEDEARHAELAWRFVAWALQAGGDAARRAVAAAFDAALAAPPPAAPAQAAPAGALAAHGRLEGAALASTWRRAIADVITPAMRTLLSAQHRG